MRTIDACNGQTLGNNQSIAILAVASATVPGRSGSHSHSHSHCHCHSLSRVAMLDSHSMFTVWVQHSTRQPPSPRCHSAPLLHSSHLALSHLEITLDALPYVTMELTTRPSVLGQLYGNASATWTAEWQLFRIASGTLVRPQGGSQQSWKQTTPKIGLH